MKQHPQFGAYLALICVCFFWGTTYLGFRIALDTIGPATIVCVARLRPVKNLGVLLHACRLLKDRGLAARTVVIGEGPSLAELEALRATLDLEQDVSFEGAQDQATVCDWWQRATVGVLTSDSEGMPVSLMEAAACGVPAVAPAVGGIPELIAHGETGFVTAPNTPEAIADGLARILSEPELRARMSEAARTRAETRFSSARQVDMLERLGFESPDWRTLGLGLTASLAAFFVALSLYLAWRYREPPRDWPFRLHAEVARRLARRGLTQGAAEGPVAFLDRSMQACPDLARDLATIRDLYVSLRYGPLPTEADLRRLKHVVNRLRP